MRNLSGLRVGHTLTLLALVVLTASACVIEVDGVGPLNGSATEEWSKSYALAPEATFTLINVNGPIEVERAAGTAVEVHATRTARAVTDDDAKKALVDLELREEVSPASVRVETRHPAGWRMGRSYSVHYHVKIPSGLRAFFTTTNGKVRLENVAGELTAVTTNGGVSAVGVGGTLDARTTNGGLDIEMASVTGDLSFRTVNGGVTLRLPPATRASVNAHCVNGGIHVDDFAFNGDLSRRSAVGSLNGGGARIDARTVNGGIRIGRGRSTT